MAPRRLGREVAVGPTESLESRRLMSAVTAFTLVDSTMGTGGDGAGDGAEVSLGVLPSRQLNVHADVAGEVESVLFSLDGAKNTAADDAAPYAVAGDDAGAHRSWTPSVGPASPN